MMTRTQKIEELLKDFRSNDENQFDTMAAFKAGLLAGIRLRDEELLAMEFDEGACNEASRVRENYDGAPITMYSPDDFEFGARWQFEQFIKAIKGDGDDN